MIKNIKKFINYNLVFYLICSLSLIGLFIIFPVLGDDLLHGSVGNGLYFMETTNGRYLGNLFGINLSSNLIIRVVVKFLVIIGILYLIYKNTNDKKKEFFLIPLLIFFLIPKDIFRQVIVNSSGFGNYVVPCLGILFIIYYHFYGKPTKNKLGLILFLVLGIINSLFVEHITIYNVLLSIFLMIFSFFKEKDKKNYYFIYMIGSIAGTILMFSNSVYISSFLGNDEYRSISRLHDLSYKFSDIISSVLYNNIIQIVLLSCLILIVARLHKKKPNIVARISEIILGSFLFYSIIKFINPSWQLLSNYTKYFEIIFAILFYLSIVYVIFSSSLKNSDKYKLLFLMVSYVIVLGPLLVVNPIGPRCYIFNYFLIILFCNIVIKILNDKKIINIEKISSLISVGIISLFVFYYSIYMKIYISSENRINEIKTEISSGETEVPFNMLPYSDFLHGAETCPDYNERVYRIYYKIDDKIIFKKDGC